MARLQWAKFPTMWLKPPQASADGAKARSPLTELMWARHAGTGIAAILVLMALAIRLNQSYKDRVAGGTIERTNTIAVTFEDLRKMTGLAKGSISKALMLLESFQALEVVHQGRSNSYKLLGLDVAGGWCMLPHGWLLKSDGTLKTFAKIPRNRVTLNALKAYVALMHLRDNKLNTAAASFTAIERWTGIRREEIATALSTLAALQLVRVSPDRDFRHSKGDNSHRYSIIGLGEGHAVVNDEDLVSRQTTPEGIVVTTPAMRVVDPLPPPPSAAKSL